MDFIFHLFTVCSFKYLQVSINVTLCLLMSICGSKEDEELHLKRSNKIHKQIQFSVHLTFLI